LAKRNEYVVATLLEPVEIGKEFIEWPLHITIVPWFQCNDDKKLDALLTEIAEAKKNFVVKVGEDGKLGLKKDVPVNLVEINPNMIKLHWSVFKTLDKNSFSVHQKQWVGDNFLAHITHQSHGQKHEGDVLAIKSFTLIKQVQQKKTGVMVKSTVKNYELG
jgi:hypothetical protein